MRGNIKFMVVALSMLTALVVGLGIRTGAATIDTTRDCDKFAVIKCGTMTAAELRTEYDSLNVNKSNGSTTKQADIPAIFTALGIKRADLDGNFVKGVVYQDGTVRVNGKIVAKNAQTAIRNVSGTAIKGSTTAKLVSTSKMGSAQEALVRLNAKGQFVFAVMTPCGNPVKATNVVPEPVYSCDALTPGKVAKATDLKRSFTVKASADKGASIKDYTVDFGDGKKTANQKSNAFTHTYAKPGTYTVTASVRVDVAGSVKTVTSSKCSTKITIDKPVTPVYACKDMTATPKEIKLNQVVTFDTTVTATGGAVVKDYTYNFGDGTTQTVKNSKITHEYKKAGTFTATVTPSFTVNGATKTHTSAACKETITVKASPAVDITKKVNNTSHIVVEVNKPFVYTLVVTNRGDIDLKNVKVTDTPEAGVVLQSSVGNIGTITNNTWSHTIPSLKVKESVEFKLNAVVPAYKPNKIINNACVDAPEVPGNPDDCDKATVEVKEVKVKACNTETGVIEWVKQGKENTPPFTTDLSKCDKVKVCDTKTMLITTVTRHEAENNDRYVDVNSDKCKVQVCDPDTGKIITVPKEDEDKYAPVDSDKCKVEVCDPDTGKIITVPKEDEGKYAPIDSDKCKVQVCDPESKDIITVPKEDQGKYLPVDSDKCKEEPVTPPTDNPKAPPTLPQTGMADILQGIIGIGTLTAASYYYAASRRS
ncbi:MAG TPA: PKD domain-containing protein [Candidatus Saccharibacteria bacterium]|jgi:uncharacterized repeat protein (TIGR01451 family)|nr:PKD domain-containing protein [Candidatus Saccharibacteria bacterium]HMR38293.1 PKD domain-containing protein [Candidatus Saccharibacteria bacterium]